MPKLVRLYIQSVALGFLISAAFTGGLLWLDVAGLGHLESQTMIGQLRSLREKTAILLVEHDMEAVYALADRISVLAGGRLLASGSAKDIQSNAQVRAAYLGEDEVDLDALTC